MGKSVGFLRLSRKKKFFDFNSVVRRIIVENDLR